MKTDVIIIGAGAAGLLAAGRAAERGCRVVLLEKMERAGRKLLITGKGRCNITNDAALAEFISHIHPDGRFLRPAFVKFFTKDIVKLLNDYGLETKTERGGRIFPQNDLAADVVHTLLKWIADKNVTVLYGSKVERFLRNDAVVSGVVYAQNGIEKQLFAENVILCAGGKSYPATGSNGDGFALAKMAGHSVTPIRPSLVPMVTAGDSAGKMQGLSLRNVKASLWVDGKKQGDEFGEMLFTHFGLSGPIVLTLSRMAVDALADHKVVEISIDLKPALDDKTLDNRLLRDLNTFGKKQLENIFREWLPSKMIAVFLSELNLNPLKLGGQLGAEERKRIRVLMKDFRFRITGNRGFKEAIITAGGISTDEIDPKTMQSKLLKGLYFAGEVIDADADTGGFNLQIAWSTGYLAGDSVALPQSD